MTTPATYGKAGQILQIIPYADPGERGMTIVPDADPHAFEVANALERSKQSMLERTSPNRAVSYNLQPGQTQISKTLTSEQQEAAVDRAFAILAKNDLYGTVDTFKAKVLSDARGYWEAVLHVLVRAGDNFGASNKIDYQQEFIQTPEFKKIEDLLKNYYKDNQPYFLRGAINRLVKTVINFWLSKGIRIFVGGNPKGVTRKYKYRKFNVSSKRFRTKKSYKKSSRHNKRQSRRK